MKKKLIITVAIVLVLCMTCGLLLAACNKDEDPPKKPIGNTESWDTDGKSLLTDVFTKIADSVDVGDGKKFVADFDVTLNIDDKTEAAKDMLLRFIVKGAINVNEGNESAFIIQVSNVTDSTNEVVYFGLAYDGFGVKEDTTPYLYINAANSGYKKINAFSLTGLVNSIVAAMNKDSGTSSAEEETLTLDSVLTLLGTAGLYGDAKVNDYGKTYELELKLADAFTFVYAIASNFINADIINALNGVLNTTFKDATELGAFISGYLNRVGINLTFNFDDNAKFLNGNVAIEYVDEEYQPVGEYTLSVNKAVIDVAATMDDVFAGTGLTDDVKAQKAVNLFNFTLDAVVKSYNVPEEGKELGEAVGKYVIDIDVDVDPFVALGIIGDGSQTNIEKYLEQLGKFSITLKKGDVTLVDVHSVNDGTGVITGVYVKVIGEKTGASAIIDKEFTVMEIIQAFDKMIQDIKNSQTASGAAEDGEGEGFDFNALIEEVKKYYGLAKPFIDCIGIVKDASGKIIGIDLNVNEILTLAGSKGYDPNNKDNYNSLMINGDFVRILFSDITAGFGNAFAPAK